MAEDAKKEKRAKQMYELLCKTLDDRGLRYSKDGKDEDGDWKVHFGGTGEDLQMNFVIYIDVGRQLFRFMSPMPFKIGEEHRLDVAIATCQANNLMVDGNFDYNIDTGSIIFKMTTTFRDSVISQDLVDYMLGVTINMADEFNDKFLSLDKGTMTLDEFLKKY